jgi:threonine dehydratase
MIQRAPTPAEIWRAHHRIRSHIFRTPMRRADALSARVGTEVYLKLENWQPTGSFKVRGAFNLLSQLTPTEARGGLVAASAGNHGAAVGYAAQQLGLDGVHIFVPATAPRAKVEKMRGFGVDVREVGVSYEDAHRAAVEFEQKHGATFANAYDDVRTIAGAATTAIEMLEDAPDLDTVLVPVGGGGLISGIAVALDALAPDVRVLGIQPKASPALRDSLRDQVCYEEYAAAPTICDGLAGGIGRTVYDVARAGLVDDVIVVSEPAVRNAVALFLRAEQLLVEGSGAVGLAALIEYPELFRGQRVGLVVSGANIDADRLAEIQGEQE